LVYWTTLMQDTLDITGASFYFDITGAALFKFYMITYRLFYSCAVKGYNSGVTDGGTRVRTSTL